MDINIIIIFSIGMSAIIIKYFIQDIFKCCQEEQENIDEVEELPPNKKKSNQITQHTILEDEDEDEDALPSYRQACPDEVGNIKLSISNK